MISAIIFDCFGVIRVDAFDAAYAKFGGDKAKDLEFILDTFYAAHSGRIESSLPVFAKHLGITTEEWRNEVDGGSTLNQAVLDYIMELKKTYKVGMLSNISSGSLQRMFEPGFLDRYFDVWVASGDIGFAKPEASAYEITADRLGVRLNECVFIDDRQEYVDGANHVGMRGLLFESIGKLRDDLSGILES